MGSFFQDVFCDLIGVSVLEPLVCRKGAPTHTRNCTAVPLCKGAGGEDPQVLAQRTVNT